MPRRVSVDLAPSLVLRAAPLLMRAMLPALCMPVLVLSARAQGACPGISGETVDGHAIALPAASSGRAAILCIAAGRKAEPLLEEWYAPVHRRFVEHHGLFAGGHDADLWLVPVFTGLNKAAFGPTMRRLKEGADPEVARRVVFVRDGAEELLDALAVRDRDEPLFLVLDPAGRIVHRVSGAYTVDKLDALEEALDP